MKALRLWFTAFIFAAALARAREHPPLDQLVARSELIVKCRAEVKGDAVHYRVLETWKGEYTQDVFYRRPPAGYLYPVTGQDFKVASSPIAAPVDGRELIFFFTRNHSPTALDGKLVKHSDCLVVVNDRVTYDVASSVAGGRERIVYPLEELKSAILAAAER